MQTAPFVKANERASKDVSDMSMSDFAPKRFALKYEPMPMIGKSNLTVVSHSLETFYDELRFSRNFPA